jgi:type I restriction enzyme S subunit
MRGTRRLGDICEVRWGDTTKTKASYVPEGHPAYSASGRDGFLPHFDHEGPGVVLSAIGAQCGKTWFADGKWSCIKNTIYLKARSPDLSPRYLFYATSDPQVWPKRGAAQPFISQGDAQDVQIPLPSVPLQLRIAGILSAYDDLIENCERRIRVLDEMARALYREWFVLFRYPGHEKVPLVGSDLDKIPQGWERMSFAQAAVFENGDRGKNYPSGSDFVDAGIPFINAGHLVDGAVDLANMNYIVDEKFGQLRGGKIRKGDLLFCLRGSPGRTARTAGLRRGAIASSLAIVRPTERANEAFLFCTLAGEPGQRMATELNNGAAQPNVSVGSVQKYPLLLPPMDLLSAFARSIEPLWGNTEILRNQLSNLRRTRDLLLPRLLSGELNVETPA